MFKVTLPAVFLVGTFVLAQMYSLVSKTETSYNESIELSLQEPNTQEDSMPKPKIEVCVVGKIATGIMAVGGETTGTLITIDNVTWELELTSQEQVKLAEINNQKFVRVNGTLRLVKGVEISKRWIVTVEKLETLENQ